MNNLAIIPARGGSKRIPRKNIRDFLGMPIIAYSIKAALESGLFEEVMVSTDDDEISKIAQDYGASVPFIRTQKNSTDFATTFDVIEEVINSYTEAGRTFEYICCLYSCAPFIDNEKILEAYELISSKDYDSVFPIVSYSTPIQRALKIENGKVKMAYPEFQKTRSQDLETMYFDAGQFYWLNTSRILENKNIYTENSGCITLNEINAQDIDNEMDWEIAQLKYKLLNRYVNGN